MDRIELQDYHNISGLGLAEIKTSPKRFLNRELSWLEFNRRVLEEAGNKSHPLLERVRFLSICGSNMDEFYMVRLAGLMGQVRAGVNECSIDGLTPGQQLRMIYEQSQGLESDIQKCWSELKEELRGENIDIMTRAKLSTSDHKWLETKFLNEILPVLTPIAVDPAHPFPFIPNTGLSIALHLRNPKAKLDMQALIQIPARLGRFIRLPGAHPRFIPIEKVIMEFIGHIFSTPMEVRTYAAFRIIRDSEMEIEEEAEDLIRTFEGALKRRRRGRVIHLSLYHNTDPETLEFLKEQLGVRDHQIYRIDGLLGVRDVAGIICDDRQDLLFPPYDARFPERIREFNGDCFEAIKAKDIIIQHPYESFDVVVQFLNQAAHDPDVVSIKQTLYRTGNNSPIVAALIRAAEEGKSVTALVEIKARFDEEANIRWAKNMERAGVQVVYGFMDLKTHAKVSLVTRQEDTKLNSYVHFGTGNYHARNATIYTDLSFFTTDHDICRDAAMMFNFMTGYAQPSGLKHLAVSPINLRDTLYENIDNEIKNAKAGKPAQIWIKCNSLLDSAMTDKLYAASQAGVQIDAVVRGICTLRPGIPGLSENIRVKSIVGRFLEHSRIYCFANGSPLPSRDAKVYISSADLMMRNLSRRIEALVPITNKTVHKQILDQVMMANMKDSRQSWSMDENGKYTRFESTDDSFCAHDYFMQNPSLSGRGKALKETPMPPELTLENKTKPTITQKKTGNPL